MKQGSRTEGPGPVPDGAEVERLVRNPRRFFDDAIRNGDLLGCLLRVGELHGHYCPGSAMGTMAAVYGLRKLGVDAATSEGMEDLMAVVETNACFADGVQAVSGCTLGNNPLVYRDLGKAAVVFAVRGEPSGVRVRVLPQYRSLVERGAPLFFSLLRKVIIDRQGDARDEAAFKEAGWQAARFLIQQPFEAFLAASSVVPDLPAFAPITQTAVCPICGEELMAAKAVRDTQGRSLCRACAAGVFYEVEGQGIVRRGG